MLCYPPAIIAVLAAHRGRGRRWSVGTLLDALVPALTLGAVFVTAILPPALRVLAERGPGVLYVVVLPVLDVTAAVLLVVTMALTGSQPQRVSGWLFLGMALFASADSQWAISTAQDIFRSGTPLDAVWVLGCSAVGLGASGAPGRVHDRVMGVATLAVPLIGALASLVLVLVGTQLRLTGIGLGLAAAAILAALLRLVHAYGQLATLEETRRQARTDALTGLGNRRGLQEAVDRASRAVPFRPFAVVLADLDGFKAVNDEHGHAAGDQVLIVVAERLRRAVRPDDLVARLGGDEFLVLSAAAGGLVTAGALSRRLVEIISQPIALAGTGSAVTVGASIGVALLEEGSDAEAILRQADHAMYAAKSAARPR
jgi:diguanylate cyclase (GGDEF)-like protein